MKRATLTLAAAGLLLWGTAWGARDLEVIRIPDVPRSDYSRLAELADFWGVDRRRDAVIMAATAEQRRAIEALGFDVLIDEERTRSYRYARSLDAQGWRGAGRAGIPGFPCYRTVDETNRDLSAMAVARPELARWESIGQSWRAANGASGGEAIHALVLGNRNSPRERPPLVIMAAQHARELATAETAARFAEWLFDHYDTNPTARWLLHHREIHVIAQQNPDGRREVEEGDVLWRKNSNLGACPSGDWTGVDLNRNSDYFWGEYASGLACSQTYRGPSGASEPETQAVQAYLEQVFDRHRPGSPDALPTDPVPDGSDGLFISLHSFGEMILFPWEGSGSGSANNAPDHDRLAWLGRKFGHFTGYEVGRDILYSAGGTMTDHAYGEFGVAAYTYEIGTEFHQPCSDFEQTLWPDLRDALLYAAKAANRPYQAPSGPDLTALAAAYDIQGRVFRIEGVADDARFDRSGATEAPASDPVATPVAVRASIGIPPDQAANPAVIELEGSGPELPFAFDLERPAGVELPALLFLQATDSEGHAGVTEAIWLDEQQVFGDDFEAAP